MQIGIGQIQRDSRQRGDKNRVNHTDSATEDALGAYEMGLDKERAKRWGFIR